MATVVPTSSGLPQRGIGTRPRSIHSSMTPVIAEAVISVRMKPGRTSWTAMPSPARRTASTLHIIDSAALVMQYCAGAARANRDPLPHVRLGADTERCAWDEDRGRWVVSTSRGEYTGRVLVMAAGHLAAQVPDPMLRATLTPDYELGCKRVCTASPTCS